MIVLEFYLALVGSVLCASIAMFAILAAMAVALEFVASRRDDHDGD